MTTNPPTLTYTLEEILSRLDQKIEKQFTEVNQKMDRQFAEVNQKFAEVNHKFTEVNQKLEIIDGRPIANTSDIAFILGKAHKLIQADAKLFVKVAEDPYLPIKVLISDCTEFGLIKKRGDYLYLSSDNSPLCETGEDPTLQIASKFLTSSKHQEVKLSLEAKLKNLKDKE